MAARTGSASKKVSSDHPNSSTLSKDRNEQAPSLQASRPSVSYRRRGGGTGEPAPQPVPPPLFAEQTWLLDSREVARLLGIGRTKTFQLMQSGDLPTVHLGRCVRVPVDALQKWIAAQTSIGDD